MNLFDVYPLLDLTPEKATGSYVFTGDGTRYLDFYGGHAVISVGHAHPHYVQRISGQLDKLSFYSNSVVNPMQKELADKLGKLSDYDHYNLFLSNTGAEAVENALKVASFHTGNKRIISFNKAFHGRTSAAISVTDKPKYWAPINKTGGVTFLTLNDSESLKQELEKGDVCAVIVEGVQGIGGIYVPEPAFLQEAARLCEEYNAVFICDEIQSGYGRTGRFFAHQHAKVHPDIITVAKGMGNGFPIAGTLFHPKFEAWHGQLGTTYGGNHLACAAGLAVLEIMEEEQLTDHAARIGNILMNKLQDLPMVTEVRGKGLMIGVECSIPIKKIREELIHEKHIITGVSSDPNVLRLLPPLTVSEQEAAHFLTECQNTFITIANHEKLHIS